MGSFSWLKADKGTQYANIAYDKPYKMLIPEEFGGGFIKDKYRDYGIIVDEDGNEYDMYELLAFWNLKDSKHNDLKSHLKYDGKEYPLMKKVDKYTDHNRSIGIDIGCYDEQIDMLKYPLKLVSCAFKGTYEKCEGKSYGDPWQGSPLTRKRYEEGKY